MEAPDNMSLDELRIWFDKEVQTIVLGHEPISDDTDEIEHEELPDDPPSDSDDDMDEQDERRIIGYADH